MRNEKQKMLVGAFLMAAVFAGCAPKISGTVQLIDANMQPIPPAKESPQGTVVNMINTTTKLESASSSATVNTEGKFESPKDTITPGVYQVETTRIGYETDTQTVKIGKFTHATVDVKLKKIRELKRKSIEGSSSDQDKIINPGEVNIQPPTM